jgi:hypothetical protein
MKKGRQIPFEECGTTFANKSIKINKILQPTSISIPNERFLRRFVEIILKIKEYCKQNDLKMTCPDSGSTSGGND